MANNYQAGIEKAKAEIDELTSKLVKMQGTILENAKQFNQMLGKSGGSMKEIQSQVTQTNEGLKKLNETKKKAIVLDGQVKVKQSELAKSMISLNAQREKEENKISKLNRARVKEVDKIERNKQALLKQKAASNELSRAYVRLVAQQQKAKKTLQDLIVTQGKGSRATRKAQSDYDRLTKKVNKANLATTNFAKTGLGSTVRGFRNLFAAFGVLGGLKLFSSMTVEVFKLTREVNSMSFSIKAVIKDSIELAQTQEWLKQITNDFGADIVSTTKRYIKFRAASKEANLTASETQKIFGTVTKAAGVLGLKTDELTGIYLALEQMISKGKVTTEELRRQLGERLPGAFDIMAKAIGVSTSKLDKMLRAGEILSNEALPKFVVQLEKAYGIESVNKVDTMVASQIRMNNAWKNLVISIEKDGGKISGFFKSEFQFIADTLKQIEKLNKSQDDLLELNRAEQYKQSLNEIKDGWQSYLDLLEQEKKFGRGGDVEDGDYLKYLEKEKTKQEELNEEASKNVKILFEKRKRYEELPDLIKKAGVDKGALLSERISLRTSIEKLEVDERSLAAMKGRLDAIKELIKMENKPKKVKEDEGDDPVKKAKKLKETFDLEKYLLEQRIKLNKESAEDDKNTFEERNGYLEAFHNQSAELNSMIVNNEIEQLKRRRIEIQKDQDLTKSQRDTLLKENSDLQVKADIDQKNRAMSHSKVMSKIRDDIRNDSLKKYQDEVKKFKDISDAQRNREIADANGDKKKIKEINKRHDKALLEMQSSYISKVLKNSKDLTEEQVEVLVRMMDAIKIKLDGSTDDFKSNLKEIQDLAKDIFGTVTDTFSELFNIDTSKFGFIFDELAKDFDNIESTSSKLFSKDKIGAWADLSKEIIGSVLDASLRRYELELQAAQRTRDTILNDELATEEQKEAARRKFEEEERRIRTERAKQERENNLIKIAIDTSVGIVKTFAQMGFVAGLPFASILAGFGAAQAAFVASQPLPKFFTGVENSQYEGWATKDEKGAEIQTDKYGNIKDFGQNKGSKYTYVEKGDNIFTANKTKELMSSFNDEDMQKAVFEMNMASNGDVLSQNIVDRSLLREVGGLRKDIDVMGRRIEKMASRPVNVNNIVELKDNRAY